MPLRFVTGSMFDYPADARVCAVNCIGVMGKGVAYAFKQRYPSVIRAYKKDCRNHFYTPGIVREYKVSESLTAICVATKDDWRFNSEYEWIDLGLCGLVVRFEEAEYKVVTMPALGCGNGGLQWAKVRKMIESRLSDTPVDLIVTEP